MKTPNPQKDLVFLAAKRTAFGAFGGALKDQTATDLAVHAAKAAIAALRAASISFSCRRSVFIPASLNSVICLLFYTTEQIITDL